MPFKKTTSKKTATDDKKGKKTDASDKSAKKKGDKKPLPFFLKKKFEDKSKKAKVEKKPVAKKKKKSVVKESFDGFIKHLLKESFGLLKKKVVEEKIRGKVWSINQKTNLFEEKEITNWHFNGKVEKSTDFIHFETEGLEGQNIISFTEATFLNI